MKETEENEMKKDVEEKKVSSKPIIVCLIIAILILASVVALAVILEKSNKDPESNPNLSISEVDIFNSKFLEYEGEQQASSVKALMTKIASNALEDEKGRKIAVYEGKLESTPGTVQSKVVSTDTYMVSFEYDSEGYINKVTVKEKEL